MSIKAFAATAIILLLVGSFIEAITRDILSRPDVILNILRGLAH
jgi:type III secretion protein T